jgi:Protein of unknown function (DUF2975)
LIPGAAHGEAPAPATEAPLTDTERDTPAETELSIDYRYKMSDSRCMDKENLAVAALRVFLVMLFGVLVLFQVMSLPGQFAHMAREDPEMAYLRWPATAVTVFWVLCIQVVIVSTWQLLTLVKNDRIFSDASLGWVNAIVAAIGAGWLVLLGVFLYVGFRADDPGLPLLLFLMVIGVTVSGLLMVVMRALLRQATTLRTDMEAVI